MRWFNYVTSAKTWRRQYRYNIWIPNSDDVVDVYFNRHEVAHVIKLLHLFSIRDNIRLEEIAGTKLTVKVVTINELKGLVIR